MPKFIITRTVRHQDLIECDTYMEALEIAKQHLFIEAAEPDVQYRAYSQEDDSTDEGAFG